MNGDNRIYVLDFYRGIAVFMVVMYHYCSRYEVIRFSDSLYSFFKYGFFGVHLFFILSGIVIYNSLLYSSNRSSFLTKRIIRLLPSLVFCSILTYFLVPLIDYNNVFEGFHSKTPWDFLPSLLFVPPGFWNELFSMSAIQYISGSYWSLFPEVVFYLSSSIIFFKSKRENFVRNWLLIVLIANVLRIITSPKISTYAEPIHACFFDLGINYWFYFAFGVYIFTVYKKSKPLWVETILILVLLLLEMYFLKLMDYRIIVATILILIIIGSRFSGVHHTKIGKGFIFLGKISYPLYLIHEYIGVELIYYSKSVVQGNLTFILPILIFGLIVILSTLLYEVEEYIIKVLKRKLLNRNV